MKRPAHAAQVELIVPFHDCDPLRVVWHGRYFQYLEVARTELLRVFRLDVEDMAAMGVRMFVSDARCRYNSPLSYGDKFRVVCWFSEQSHLLKVSYDLFNLTHQRRVGRAYTRFAFTDVEGTWLSEIPRCVQQRLPE